MKPTKGDAAVAIQWGGDLSSTHVAVLCLWQLTHRAMTVQSFHYRPSLYIQTLDLKSWVIRIIAVVEGVDVFSTFGEIACEKQVQPASKFSECLPYLLITHRTCAAPSSSENETQVDAFGSLVPELCVGTPASLFAYPADYPNTSDAPES